MRSVPLLAVSCTRWLSAAMAVSLITSVAPHAFAQGGFPSPMVLYRANLHCHTGYSDGYWLFWPEGENPVTAYAYSSSRGLDAMAVTDHGEMLNTTEWTAGMTAALQAGLTYWPFCAVHGFEWSGTYYVSDTGHVNVYGSQTRIGAYKTGQNTDDDVFGTLGALYGWLTELASAVDSDRPGAPLVVAQFNHPTAHDTSDHHNGYLMPSDARLRKVMALFEMGSWTQDPDNPYNIVYEGTAADNDTFDPLVSAEYWYRIALAQGWRVAPTNNGDNHLGGYVWHHDFGPPTCTGIYMLRPSASSSAEARRSALLDALRARRTFAAEDRDAEVILSADAGASPQPWWMGTAFGPPPGSSVTIRVQASDPTDRIKGVELICPDGSKVAEWTNLNTFSVNETVVLTDAQLAALPTTDTGEICLYAKVTEKDGELLFAAPLWISRPQCSSSMTTPGVFGSVGPVRFDVTLRRDDTGEGLADKPVMFTVDGAPIGTVTTDGDGRATLPWVVPSAVSYAVTTEFAGDGEAGASYATRNVDSATFTSLATLDRTGTVTELTTLRGYLKRTSDSVWLPGKTITFKIDGTEVGSGVTDANGHAAFLWTITTGPATRTIAAEFAGDETYHSSIGTAKLTALTWGTKMVVYDRTGRITQYTIFKAVLFRSDNSPLPNKTISFSIDGTALATDVTRANGEAKIGYVIPSGAGAGARIVNHSFAGDPGYAAISKNATLTVQQALPYIWVMSRSCLLGHKVALYAYFRRLYDYQKQPAKTVDFRVDGTLMHTMQTNADGVAYFIYQTVEPQGAHTIRCEFAGDAWVEPGSGEGTLTVL